ncbi:M48 family metallopeptidase [Natronobacterium gregoryi]|nr:Zn-dependent protease with chaperone function [Natronobacterium gregoryi SP2]PLK20152.1 peptidase M48 [Natronobacterium gregoryi SP2]SFJ32417.1 heat shock protein HtpX [Natronobacterium gregoryi]
MTVAAVLGLFLSILVVSVALLLVGLPIFGVLSYGTGALETVVPIPVAASLAVAVAVFSVVAVEVSLRAVREARDRRAPAGALAQGAVDLGSYVLVFSSLVVAVAALPSLSSVLPTPVFAFLVLLGAGYLLTIAYVWTAYLWVRSRNEEGTDERTEGGAWIVLGLVTVAYASSAWWTGFAALVPAALVWLVVAAVVAPGHVDRVRDVIERRAARAAEEEPVDPERVYGVADETRRLLARLERVPGPTLLVPALAVAFVLAVGWTATVVSVDALAVGLAVVGSIALVGGHVGGAVRNEFTGDIAVLRDLESRFDLESLERGRADDESPDSDTRRLLESTVTRLAGQANVPVPDVQVVDRETPAALTVGYRPSSSTIVVSRGLVASLDERELEAVLAHELAHVTNRDAAVLTALSVPGSVATLSRGRYGFNPVAEPFAMLVRAVSRWSVAFVARGREYAADEGAVAITGDAAALASALETVDHDLERRPRTDLRNGELAAAFSIVPPPWEEHRFFDRTRRFVARRIFGTHPPTETRISKLRARV